MKLSKVKSIENYSGVSIRRIHAKILPLRKGHYKVLDIPVGGDAPKDFICAYQYGEGRKKKPAEWPKYIAKVGHKWYPMESIMEYLLNRIGEVIGLNMAESKLRLADEQIRFLSKYFLEEDETLVHGAQVFSGYLEEKDDNFVEEIEQKGLTRELLTFQVAIEAIDLMFPDQKETIQKAFVKMLCFDAITGNNDRHFYNWGIIANIKGKKIPRFSPIYDTARGLFWNYSEEKIDKLFTRDGTIDEVQFTKYLQNSMPKIGWEGLKRLNHFILIRNIVNDYDLLAEACTALLDDLNLRRILHLLDSEFKHLFSENRYILVKECITRRFQRLKQELQPPPNT